MITIRRSGDRGDANHGWLHSKHTFSFADFYDSKHMGFGVLRVINEDRIEGGTGFGTHGHRDMEIVSYVIEGALEHKDSMGSDTIIKPGDVQRMSAGTGVRHSEHNHSKNSVTHFLQIWIAPEENGIAPGYGQKSFEREFKSNDLILVASKTGRDGSITINQDVAIFACKAKEAGEKALQLQPARKAWIQVIRGTVKVGEESLAAGDGAAVEKVETLVLAWSGHSEFLVFDLP